MQLQKSFVVGPGYTPVPYKIVNKIITGKFVNLEDLLAENITTDEPEPELLFDGRVVLTHTAKKPKRKILDIISWLEAFSIYCLIVGSYFPHRWNDLTKYKLLIMRTFRQFGGQGWISYDREFREHAAAEMLTDWSKMNVQLYNFYTAGAPVRHRLLSTNQHTATEPTGNDGSSVICTSWNAGHCVAPSAYCRFRHVCGACKGDHRMPACESSHSRYSLKFPQLDANKRMKHH